MGAPEHVGETKNCPHVSLLISWFAMIVLCGSYFS